MKKLPIAITLAITSMPAFAQQSSWTSYLGAGLNDFEAGLIGAGECKREVFAPTIPPVSLDLKATGHFHRPVSWAKAAQIAGRTGPVPSVTFPAIKIAACSVREDAVVKAYEFEGEIFRVELAYATCRGDWCSRSDWAVHSFDEAFLAAYGNDLTEAVTAEQVEAFRSFFANEQLSPLAFDLKCTANWAGVGRTPYDRYRCLVRADVENGVWIGAGAVEFFTPGFFGDAKHGRFATYLEFIDVDRQVAATADVTRRVMEIAEPLQATLRDRLAAEDTKRRTEVDVLTTVR